MSPITFDKNRRLNWNPSNVNKWWWNEGHKKRESSEGSVSSWRFFFPLFGALEIEELIQSNAATAAAGVGVGRLTLTAPTFIFPLTFTFLSPSLSSNFLPRFLFSFPPHPFLLSTVFFQTFSPPHPPILFTLSSSAILTLIFFLSPYLSLHFFLPSLMSYPPLSPFSFFYLYSPFPFPLPFYPLSPSNFLSCRFSTSLLSYPPSSTFPLPSLSFSPLIISCSLVFLLSPPPPYPFSSRPSSLFPLPLPQDLDMSGPEHEVKGEKGERERKK